MKYLRLFWSLLALLHHSPNRKDMFVALWRWIAMLADFDKPGSCEHRWHGFVKNQPSHSGEYFNQRNVPAHQSKSQRGVAGCPAVRASSMAPPQKFQAMATLRKLSTSISMSWKPVGWIRNHKIRSDRVLQSHKSVSTGELRVGSMVLGECQEHDGWRFHHQRLRYGCVTPHYQVTRALTADIGLSPLQQKFLKILISVAIGRHGFKVD